MLWGLNPGPLLFTNEPDFAWGLIASLFLANVVALMCAWGVIPLLIKILSVPTRLIVPCITVICVVGAYSTSNSMYGVLVMLIAGVLGYVMHKFRYPAAPVLLAFVLAPMLESNMRKSFIISRGSLDIFFDSPISLAFMTLFIVILLFPTARTVFSRFSRTAMEAAK